MAGGGALAWFGMGKFSMRSSVRPLRTNNGTSIVFDSRDPGEEKIQVLAAAGIQFAFKRHLLVSKVQIEARGRFPFLVGSGCSNLPEAQGVRRRRLKRTGSTIWQHQIPQINPPDAQAPQTWAARLGAAQLAALTTMVNLVVAR